MWDVAIVGAGPAGAAAALSALRTRPGARVLLLDRSDFPRDKACGDGIAPQALDELARLGAAEVLADRVPVQRLRVQAPDGTVAARRLRRPDHVVPRAVFDARLVQAAVDRGAVLQRHTVRRLEVRPDAVLIDGVLAGRVVVGADGANGVVRRQLGSGRQPAPAEGIYYALLSGRLAGAAAFAADPGRAHAAGLRRELGRHLRHTTALARATARAGVVDAGMAATARSERAFHDLVELGLGRGLVTPSLVGGIAGELLRRLVRSPAARAAQDRAAVRAGSARP